MGWYLSYNDTRMSTIQLNTPEKTQKSANFASKNSMKILAIKRGKCLAKQKEWVKKSKKTGSEEKAKGKSQFCFLRNVFARSSNICSNMLVSEQKAAECSVLNFK